MLGVGFGAHDSWKLPFKAIPYIYMHTTATSEASRSGHLGCLGPKPGKSVQNTPHKEA